MATGLNNLANVIAEQGDYMRALPLLERSLVIRERTLGPEHPLLASPLIGLSEVLVLLGRPAEAVAPSRRAVALDEAAGSLSAEMLAQSRATLARALWDSGDAHAEAIDVAQRAVLACTQADERGKACAAVGAFLAEHPG